MASLQVLASDVAVFINEFDMLGLVQNADWAPNFNAEDIFELGNTAKVASTSELETTGSIQLLAVGHLPGLLARMQVARTAGDFTGYTYDSAGGGGKNAYVFDQDDLSEMIFNLTFKQRRTQGDFNRSIVLPRCFLTNLSGRYDVNGNAEATISWQGDFVLGLPDPYHDVVTATAQQTADLTAQLDNFASTETTDYTEIYLYVNERKFDSDSAKATYILTLDADGLVTLSTSENFKMFSTDIIMLVMYRDTSPSTIFPTILSANRAVTALFAKGYQIDAFIGPSDPSSPTSGEQWLRAQDIDWAIDMRVDALRQLAFSLSGTTVYARLPQYPFDITLNATVTESEWEDWKATLTHAFDASDVYEDSYRLGEASVKDAMAIVIHLNTVAGVKVSDMRFLDMKLDGYSNRVAVGGRSEVTLAFRGSTFRLEGFNV